MAGVFRRAKNILESNILSVLENLEDPVKEINRVLVTSKEDVAEVKGEIAKVRGTLNSLKRQMASTESKIQEWETAARNALKAGDEDAARHCLSEKSTLESRLEGEKQNVEMTQTSLTYNEKLYNKLCSDIKVMEQKLAVMRVQESQAKSLETVTKAHEAISERSVGNSITKFEDKVSQRLDKAKAAYEMSMEEDSSPNDDILRKYGSGGNSSVDAELEKMKQEMGL